MRHCNWYGSITYSSLSSGSLPRPAKFTISGAWICPQVRRFSGPSDRSGSIVRVIETGDADTTTSTGNYTLPLPWVFTHRSLASRYFRKPLSSVWPKTPFKISRSSNTTHTQSCARSRSLGFRWQWSFAQLAATICHPGISEILPTSLTVRWHIVLSRLSWQRRYFRCTVVVCFNAHSSPQYSFLQSYCWCIRTSFVHLWLDDGKGITIVQSTLRFGRCAPCVLARKVAPMDWIDFSDVNVVWSRTKLFIWVHVAFTIHRWCLMSRSDYDPLNRATTTTVAVLGR
jgi:hypothetical protein